MSFRDRMQTNKPKAEETLQIELQNRQLLQHFYNKNTAIVFTGNGQYLIVPEERLTFQLINSSEGFTVPDHIARKDDQPIYLDGPPHLKFGVKNRDNRINRKLESCSLVFHRFPYKGRLSKQRLNEICTEIQEMVKT